MCGGVGILFFSHRVLKLIFFPREDNKGESQRLLSPLLPVEYASVSGPSDLETLTSNITAVAELEQMSVTHQGPVFESWEMTLSGKPWAATREQAVAARMFLSKMFEALISRGWALVNRLDLIYDSTDDKCALVFVRSVPVVCKFACIYVSGKCGLILIDLPEEVTISLAALIRRSYAPGVLSEKKVGLTVYEIELNGLPWIAGYGKKNINGEVLHGRALMADILADLTARSWQAGLRNRLESIRMRPSRKNRVQIRPWKIFPDPTLFRSNKIHS